MEVVRFLLRNGADITVANNSGMIPVYSASNSKLRPLYKYWAKKYANCTFTLGG